MARIQLENNLGVTVQRTLFTGQAYVVEPPPAVPPNGHVFWQSNDSGAVTYQALPPGTTTADVTGTSTPLSTAAPVVSSVSRAATDPSTDPTLPGIQPVTTIAKSPITAPLDRPAATAMPQFTLAWEVSAAGRPTYRARGVDHSLHVRVQERPDGALYIVGAHRKNRRILHAPRRSRRLAITLGIIAALLVATTAGASALGISGAASHLPILSALFHTSPPATAKNAAKKAALQLTVSHKGVPIGQPVVLTATVEGQITASGYHIDIVNKATNHVENAVPCAPTQPCSVTVTSASPTSIIYRAYVERSFLKGIQVASPYVRATWLPQDVPTTITLSANPAADSTHTVHARIGTPVTLTAHTNRTVTTTGYQITVVDASHDTTPLTGSPCRAGTSCAVQVNSGTAATIIYIAYVEASNHSGTRLPSETITVIWSASPPPMPTTVYLTSKPAPTAGTVHVVIGTTVSLTATADNPVDNTDSYIQLHNDTTGAQVGGPCMTGLSCGAPVRSTVPTTDVYKAYIVRASSNAIVKVSSPITIVWTPPQPPTSISLSTSETNPLVGQSFTLRATTPAPVDGTGYEVQIVDLAGYNSLKTCTTGSSCLVSAVCDTTGTTTYQAFVDQGNPTAPHASSNQVSVTCSPPPQPPTCINLSDNSGGPGQSGPVTFTANTCGSVDSTGYEIQIYDLTNGALLGTCTAGSSCQATESNPDPSCGSANYVYQAFVDQGSQGSRILSSNQDTVNWFGGICTPTSASRRTG